MMLTALLASFAPAVAVAQASASGSMTGDASAAMTAGGTHLDSRARASATSELTAARPAATDRSQSQPQRSDRAQREQAMRGLSATARARAEATFRTADEETLPDQPVASAMLEARAKGATEAQVVGAGQQALARLQVAKQTMVNAGRPTPSSDEVSRGANLLARGATSAQLEAFTQQSPSDRALSTSLTSGANVDGTLSRDPGQAGGVNGVAASVSAAGTAGAALGHGVGGATAGTSVTGGLAGGLPRP
ncbi:MAG TPA: hypothetical protein VFS11_06930 [Gemmatimonadales bacterium]|nr:hypothetical protein [Gemmatimonadales bacterium]